MPGTNFEARSNYSVNVEIMGFFYFNVKMLKIESTIYVYALEIFHYKFPIRIYGSLYLN